MGRRLAVVCGVVLALSGAALPVAAQAPGGTVGTMAQAGQECNERCWWIGGPVYNGWGCAYMPGAGEGWGCTATTSVCAILLCQVGAVRGEAGGHLAWTQPVCQWPGVADVPAGRSAATIHTTSEDS